MTALTVVPGSIAAMAASSGQIIPPALCVLFDVSFSMQSLDGTLPNGVTANRFMAGVAQLTELQAQYPGQIVLIEFAEEAVVRPGGMPNEPVGMNTLLVPGLMLAKELDTGLMRFVVVSDGLPYDASAALEVAQSFQVGIDTIAIGTENQGETFMRNLAAQTGGTYHRDRSGLRQLGAVIRALLTSGEALTPEHPAA